MVRVHEVDGSRGDSSGVDSAADSAGAEVRRIAAACDEADGVSTLNEQAVLQLKHRGLRDASLWLGEDAGGSVAGFALLHSGLLDLAVHPDSRGAGVGSALASAVAATSPGRIEAWSHSDHPAAGRLAERFDVRRKRELVVMRRPTDLPVQQPAVPPGVWIRTFDLDDPRDQAAVLAVNATAFAHHAEQGDLSATDFEERTREPWFDPGGLFLAVPEDSTGLDDPADLLGFHWTKVPEGGPADGNREGEVYVVAVNPKAAGRGLGTLLTAVGLAHLRDRGVDSVLLYVDGDNAPALAVYTGLGFGVERTEAQYRGTLRP